MAAKAERAIVVLSADEERLARIHGLCQREGNVTVRWVSDPTELLHLMQTKEDTAQDIAPLVPHSTGLILDLTMPPTTSSHIITQSEHETDWQATTIATKSPHMEWYTVALLALGHSSDRLPWLVISDDSYLRRVLALMGITVVGQITSDASPTEWRTMLHVLLAYLTTPQTQLEHASSNRSQVNTRTSSIIHLRPDLQLDLDGAILRNAGEAISLSAREVALLTILLRAPGHYLKSSYLADQLTPPGSTFPVEEHSVEQMISALRRKMGERGQHNGVLRNRRGLGYAIFPLPHAEPAVELARARYPDLSN